VEEYGRARQATDDNIIQHMRFACWISKATDTHSVYVIHITFRRQQWLCERASILHYTYIPCLVCNRKAASVLWVIDVSYKTEKTATFETFRKFFSTDDVINENNQKYSLLAKWIQTLHLTPGGRYGRLWHNKPMSWQHNLQVPSRTALQEFRARVHKNGHKTSVYHSCSDPVMNSSCIALVIEGL
jgi:hypothetical protein